MSEIAARYRAAGFFILRVPLVPLSVAERQLANPEGPSTSGLDQPATSQGIPQPADAVIDDLLETPDASEALHVAAPEFLALLERRQGWDWSLDERRHARVAQTARRYLLRMSYRPTPFGIFASSSLGVVGGVTRLTVPPRASLRRHTRLDAEAMYSLCSVLMADRAMLLSCPVVCNTTLYRVMDEWRFVERHTNGVTEYSFLLGAVESSPIIDALIHRSRQGTTGTALVEYLVASGYPTDAATDFVVSVIHAQVLVSALVPAVVGRDSLQRLHDLLVQHAPHTRWPHVVEQLKRDLARADTVPVNQVPDAYRAIEATLEVAGVKAAPGRTIHVDVYRDGEQPIISKRITETIRDGAIAMEVLTSRAPRREFLAGLRDAFIRRYGDRDVPLLHLFDPSIGLAAKGGPHALVGEAERMASINNPSEIMLTPTQEVLLQELSRVSRNNSNELTLDTAQLAEIGNLSVRTWPATFSVLASLYGVGSRTGRGSDEQVIAHVKATVGGSPAALLGRFLHGHAALKERVDALLEAEQARRLDVVLAEIHCATGPRTPNVSRRPHLRDHEITIVGPADSDREMGLSIADLYVRIEDGRFVLWSEEIHRRVLPRLSSMQGVDPSRDMGLHAFLVALQYQDGIDQGNPEFVWGALRYLPWLPRIRVGNAILARETWLIRSQDLTGPVREARQQLINLLARTRVPQHVLLTTGDVELPLNLERDWAIGQILATLRADGVARLQEDLLTTFVPIALGSDGPYANEVVVPFLSSETGASTGSTLRPVRIADKHPYDERRYPPGTEWLYLKVYMPPSAMNRVLVTTIGPIVRELLDGGVIDAWFFLRYADSSEHLRVRLHCHHREQWIAAYDRLHQGLATDARFTDLRIELGTYEPETRRYGGAEAARLTERLFHLDSELALDLLGAQVATPDRQITFLTNVLVVDRLLDCLVGEGSPHKQSVVESTLRSYHLRMTKRMVRERTALAGELHRKIVSDLRDGLLGASWPPASNLVPATVFKWLEAMCEPAREARGAMVPDGLLGMEEWAGAVLHMHCNRLFDGHIIEQEQLVLDLLARQYRAAHGRARKT